LLRRCVPRQAEPELGIRDRGVLRTDDEPPAGDQMWWQFAGESAGPPAAATFTAGTGGRAASLTLDNFNDEELSVWRWSSCGALPAVADVGPADGDVTERAASPDLNGVL